MNLYKTSAKFQCFLGKVYYYGYYGVTKDHRKSMLMFAEAAEQGSDDAAYYLCVLNWNGIIN